MPKIFISYRREDSEFPTHLIYEQLTERFGHDSVFMDVDAIPLGIDFRQKVDEAVDHSDILLAVIGNQWLDCTDSTGDRRLDDPDDLVRTEITSAISQGIPVIPLLVGSVSMPKRDRLPDALRELANRNAIQIKAGREFKNHVEALIEQLECHPSLESCHYEADSANVDNDAGTSLSIRVRLGRFKLIVELARGGLECIYKARDLDSDSIVVVKEIRGKTDYLDEALSQWLRLQNLSHPGIADIIDVGRENDRLIIATEFIQGKKLSDLIHEESIGANQAAALCRKLAVALHYLHSKEVVHRDVRPQQILVDRENQPHLLLSQITATQVSLHCRTGRPCYMSPEQVKAAPDLIDGRTDIYSLGVVLFQLLTGARPFDEGSLQRLLRQIECEEPTRPTSLNNRIPLDLEAICLRCLEKDRNTRYETADELAQDLARFAECRPVSARRPTLLDRAWFWYRSTTRRTSRRASEQEWQ